MLSIHVERDQIIEALSVANEIAPIKQITSILANVHLSVKNLALTIRSTNLSIGFETTLNIEQGSDGMVLLLCDKLINVIKNFPSGVVVIEQIDDAVVKVSSSTQKNIEYTLYISKDMYPEFVSSYDGEYIFISQKDFKSMIHKTIFAVSQDESRLNISGVFLDTGDNDMVLVGTDGRRLSQAKLHGNGDNKRVDAGEGTIIPIKILTLIERYAEEGQIGLQLVDGKALYVKLYDYYFSTSLIDEEFPNYKRVVPDTQQYLIEANNEELSTAIKQVALLSEKTKRITLTILENMLVINSDQAEIGKAKIEIGCRYSGPETKIALNYSYILDPLRVMGEYENIAIGFTENNRALSLYPVTTDEAPQEQEEIHVVMPMQLD